MFEDAPMKTPGTQLREAREARGLSIGEAAALTRIPRNLLVSLEADCVEEFKADVFLNGHIRNYARELGLDAEPLIRRFDTKSSPVTATAPVSQTTAEPRRMRRKSTSFGVKPTHMFAVLLVLAGIGIFASLLSGGRATAKDTVQFPAADESAWELEQDVQDTRWLLEQQPNP